MSRSDDDFDYDDFGDVAAELALALPPVDPSPDLKARLMAQVAVTPQLPARTSEPAPSAEPAPTAGLAPVTSLAPAATPATDARPASPAEQKANARWFTRTSATLVAAAAAVALFFGGVVSANLFQPGDDAQQLAAIVAAPDVQTVAAPVTDGGSATLVSSESLGLSAMVFDGLPELSDDEAYALWYITDGEPTPAGLFTVEENGEVVQVLDGAFEAGTIVGVTVEPSTGSPAPTTTPIVAIPTEA
ncbi:MAG: anti-sigma factor [Microcella sp.]|uniref:anti-sigma factor n=1 Tax=Microcella sp. TaxID=1913979 RepID=UPI00271C32FA|nr:anti-sigma factor [Microcella sp.]MDO8338593.1 anti-sigma factor [Microcella sp.]